MEFAERLEKQMKALELNPDQLAARMQDLGASVQGQTVRLWGKGRNMPRAEHLPVLTRVLRCHLEDLIPLPRPTAVH